MSAQPLTDLLIDPSSKGDWYPSYETGMAFCRVTNSLTAKSGTKPEKEQRCLERMLNLHLGGVCRDRAIKLVDLGTGDGQKMLLTIRALSAAGAAHIRYVPVDTNPYISRYAILNILGAGKPAWSLEDATRLLGPMNGVTLAAGSTHLGLEALARITYASTNAEYSVGKTVTIPAAGVELDFFQQLPDVVRITKQLGRGLGLFCLLGNTFGNYSADQRETFLATLYSEVGPGDLFLLGVGLRPNAGSSYAEQVRMLEREYRPGEAFMRPAADHPESIYRLRFDPASQSMIHGFERPDRSVQAMGFSHLFAAGETLEAIERNGFELVAHETYPDTTEEPQYLTVLARKPVTERRP